MNEKIKLKGKYPLAKITYFQPGADFDIRCPHCRMRKRVSIDRDINLKYPEKMQDITIYCPRCERYIVINLEIKLKYTISVDPLPFD